MKIYIMGGPLEAMGVAQEERETPLLSWVRVAIDRLYFPLTPHLNLLASNDFPALLRSGATCYELPEGAFFLLRAKYDPPWQVPYFARNVVLGIVTKLADEVPRTHRAIHELLLRS